MKIRFIKPLAVILALILSVTSLASCVADVPLTESNNIEVIGAIYTVGEQSVRVMSSIPNDDGGIARFKDSIAPAHIRLDGALNGKTVTAVNYISQNEILITMSGSVIDKTATAATVYIDPDGLLNDYASYCSVNVERPAVIVSGYYYSSVDKTHVCTYSLPWGSFTELADATTVTITNASAGAIKVTRNSNGTLTVSVTDFKSTDGSSYPKLRFLAETTPFATEFTIGMGSSGSVTLE